MFREIKFALEKALDMPEGRIFLIPARLEECEVPSSLRGYQWVDLFQKNWNRRLMSSLNRRAAQLGLTLLPYSGAETQPPVITTQPEPSADSSRVVSPRTDGSVTQTSVAQSQNVQEKLSPLGIPKEENKEERTIEDQAPKSHLSMEEGRRVEVVREKKQPRDAVVKRKSLLNPKLRLFIGVASVLIGVPLCIMLGVNYPINNLLEFVTVTVTSSPTNMVSNTITSQPERTNTPSSTRTPVSLTQTSNPSTPTLGISSTMTGKDGIVLLYVPVRFPRKSGDREETRYT